MALTRESRFWSKVTKSRGCWIHSGAQGSHGYPQFGGTLAHRQSWVLAHGPIPQGKLVLHTCNNKQCVNPKHLRLGTHQDNMDDLSKAGHPSRKLTRRQASSIRRSSRSARDLGRKYGIDKSQIIRIKLGKTYKV